ncbi:hypothetical protein BGZ82_001315, partial [Podila clonocystis]
LNSVPWSTLKSLVLSGDDIATWLQTLPPVTAPYLKRFDIQGSELAPLQLSHEDARFIQKLMDSWPLAELRFDNVVFQDERDWALIVESMDPSARDTFRKWE